VTELSIKLWEQITASFPADLPEQPITSCDCEECRDVRANLGHLRWNEILPPAIEKHFGSLCLLTDQAFQLLLPAYLFYALGDLNPDNQYLEWTLYTLCGAYEEDEATTQEVAAEQRKRIAGFSEPQRAAVRAFLSLAMAEPELAFHHKAIDNALVEIWM
jgi:hypothetical protein